MKALTGSLTAAVVTTAGLVLCLVAPSQALFGTQQRVAAKGRLLCGTKPAVGVKVKLVDIDSPGLDDKMDEVRTDQNGEFYVDGSTTEWTSIDPVVKIYHDCADGLKPCQRRWKMDIPKKYIGNPVKQPVVCDIGVLNLEVYMRHEKRNCF